MCSRALRILSLGALLLAAAVTLSACRKGEEGPAPADFGFFKSPNAKQACLSKNLSQWELSGSFLDKMLRCVAQESLDGGQTLPQTLQLLDSLGTDKLQKLTNFLLTPFPEGKHHAERYPYLVAFSTLLDRGLLSSSAQGLELTQERLGDLQSLLLALDPSRTKTLLAQWSHSGRLDPLLLDLGRFLSSLQEDSIEVLVNETLAGQTLRRPLFTMAREILQDDSLMLALDRSFADQKTVTLASSELDAGFENWRQARLPKDQTAWQPSRDTEHQAGPSPVAQLAAFTQTLQPAELRNLSDSMLHVWQAYRSQGADQQSSMNLRTVSALENAIDQQQSPSLWLLSVLHDLRTLPVRELDQISEALQRLVADGDSGVLGSWDSTLDTLRAKVGAQKLMTAASRLIIDGGDIVSCGGLRVPALGSSTPELEIYIEQLRWLSQPHAACHGMPPLSLALADVLGVSLQTDCSLHETAKPCLTIQKNQQTAPADSWQEATKAVKPEVLQRLLETSLAEQRRWLTLDAFSLKNQGLAHQAVSISQLDRIWRLWLDQSDKTLKGLAALDQTLNDDANSRSLLAPDFLEKMLALHIERLSSMAAQFHDLVPETASEADKSLVQRSMRTFAGLYNKGPLEESLRHRLNAATFLNQHPPQNLALAKAFHDQPHLLSQILSRLQSAESIFRSPSFATLGQEELTPFVSLGSSLANYVSFQEASSPDPRLKPTAFETSTQAEPEVIQPLQSIAKFESTDPQSTAAWALWQWQLASSALTSKDLPPTLAKAYDQWVSHELLPLLTQPSTWPELLASDPPPWGQLASGVSQEFLDTEPYSPSEARILTMYYVRHYIKLPYRLPAQRSVTTGVNPLKGTNSFSVPLRGFMNASYMSTPGSDYVLFARLFPDFLRNPDLSTLEQAQSQVLPSYEEWKQQGGFFPYAKQSLIRDVSKLRPETFKPSLRLFSTFNLLSFTRSGLNFYPQPLIGLGRQTCQSSATEKVPCPVEIQAQDEPAGYALYQDFMKEQLAQHLCPLLAGGGLGDAHIWRHRLALTVNDLNSCSGFESISSDNQQNLRFPLWMSKKILDDIFALGRVAHLKPGLAQIPSSIRFYKLAAQGLPKQAFAQRWLHESFGVWDHLNAASQSRRQKLAANFWAGSPTILSSYLDSMRLGLNADEWRQAIARVAEQDASGHDTDGLRHLLQRFVKIQKQLRNQEATVADFVMQLFDELGQQQNELTIFAALLSDYSQLENYDFLGNDLPLAALGLLQDRFDWQNLGLKFCKFLVQRETLQTWSGVTQQFTQQELHSFLEVLRGSLDKLGTLGERQNLAARFLDEVLSLGALWLPARDHVLAHSWDDVLKAWRQTNYSQNFQTQWLELLTVWDRPLQLLNGKQGPSAQSVLTANLPSLLEHGPALMQDHQTTGHLSEALFWPRLWLSYLEAIDTEEPGSRAMAHFLATDSLGFRDGAIWQTMLVRSEARQRLMGALETLVEVPQRTWRMALQESTEVIGRLQKPLGFLKTHIRWKQDPEANAFQKALEQLYALSHDQELRQRQIEVLGLWLSDNSEQTSPEPLP